MVSNSLTTDLTAAVAAVCPVDGVAILDSATKAVRIDYRPEATSAQRSAADAAAAAFDWSDAAQAARDAARNPDRKALTDAAAQALSDNVTFLAIASPTNAQLAAQVRRLTQQNTALIRRLVQID